MKHIHALWALALTSVVLQASDPLASWGEYPRPAGAGAPVSITFGNGKFVAVGTNGTVITSTDGIEWSAENSGGNQNLSLVKFVNGRFFAFGSSALTSTDGVVWSGVPNSAQMRDITYDGTAYYATSLEGFPLPPRYLLISTNLTDWTTRALTLNNYNSANSVERVLYANGKYLVSSGLGSALGAELYASDNGTSWSKLPFGTQNDKVGEITFQNGLFFRTINRSILAEVPVGPGPGSPALANVVSHSTDGVDWKFGFTVYANASPILPNKIAAGGGYFVYPTGPSIFYTNAMPTFPRFTYQEPAWARVNLTYATAAETAKSDIAFGNNVFVAATQGKLFKSNPLEGTAAIQVNQHPAALSVITGGTANFKVLAQGSDPITFQWRHAGTNLVGQTASTLTLTNVTLDMAGVYDVEITNPAGTVTSNPAMLSVQFAEARLYSGVTLRGNIGDRFLLEYQEALDQTGTWHSLTNITLSSQQYIYIDYDSSMQTNRYYRATFQEP